MRQPQVFLFCHVPTPVAGRRAKASSGAPGQATIVATTDSQARAAFRERYPHREVTASGQQGIGI